MSGRGLVVKLKMKLFFMAFPIRSFAKVDIVIVYFLFGWRGKVGVHV